MIADIPGLIEGASEGVGLGHEFLRHIERTKVIIHVVDAASTEGRDPVDDIYKINEELKAYNPRMATLPQVIAANKTDVIYSEDEDPVERIRAEFEPQGMKVFSISAVSGKGLKELLYYVRELLDALPKEAVVFEQEYDPNEYNPNDNLPYTCLLYTSRRNPSMGFHQDRRYQEIFMERMGTCPERRSNEKLSCRLFRMRSKCIWRRCML